MFCGASKDLAKIKGFPQWLTDEGVRLSDVDHVQRLDEGSVSTMKRAFYSNIFVRPLQEELVSEVFNGELVYKFDGKVRKPTEACKDFVDSHVVNIAKECIREVMYRGITMVCIRSTESTVSEKVILQESTADLEGLEGSDQDKGGYVVSGTEEEEEEKEEEEEEYEELGQGGSGEAHARDPISAAGPGRAGREEDAKGNSARSRRRTRRTRKTSSAGPKFFVKTLSKPTNVVRVLSLVDSRSNRQLFVPLSLRKDYEKSSGKSLAASAVEGFSRNGYPESEDFIDLCNAYEVDPDIRVISGLDYDPDYATGCPRSIVSCMMGSICQESRLTSLYMRASEMMAFPKAYAEMASKEAILSTGGGYNTGAGGFGAGSSSISGPSYLTTFAQGGLSGERQREMEANSAFATRTAAAKSPFLYRQDFLDGLKGANGGGPSSSSSSSRCLEKKSVATNSMDPDELGFSEALATEACVPETLNAGSRLAVGPSSRPPENYESIAAGLRGTFREMFGQDPSEARSGRESRYSSVESVRMARIRFSKTLNKWRITAGIVLTAIMRLVHEDVDPGVLCHRLFAATAKNKSRKRSKSDGIDATLVENPACASSSAQATLTPEEADEYMASLRMKQISIEIAPEDVSKLLEEDRDGDAKKSTSDAKKEKKNKNKKSGGDNKKKTKVSKKKESSESSSSSSSDSESDSSTSGSKKGGKDDESSSSNSSSDSKETSAKKKKDKKKNDNDEPSKDGSADSSAKGKKTSKRNRSRGSGSSSESTDSSDGSKRKKSNSKKKSKRRTASSGSKS